MSGSRPVVLVTGISGNLGLRLLPQLHEHDVVAVDLIPPSVGGTARFAQIDLSRESSCSLLVELVRETRPTAVVHLAFDGNKPASSRDPRCAWQTNVAGTARVMEAITEVNRSGGNVSRFLFTSGALVYGAHLDSPALETSALTADRLPYAIQQREADEVAQYRASTLGACGTTILRPALYAGASVDNCMIGAFRGTTNGKGQNSPFLPVPCGQKYQQNLLEFVHIDDVARVIAHLLQRRETAALGTTILNVAARDGALPFESCEHIIPARIRKFPGFALCEAILRSRWKRGVSAMPPEALPYLLGSRPLDTTLLRRLLGSEYTKIMRHTTRDALGDCFSAKPELENPNLIASSQI